MEKILLNIKEFATAMNIGTTKARELLRSPSCTYSVQIGNRWYANRERLNKVLSQRNVRL